MLPPVSRSQVQRINAAPLVSETDALGTRWVVCATAFVSTGWKVERSGKSRAGLCPACQDLRGLAGSASFASTVRRIVGSLCVDVFGLCGCVCMFDVCTVLYISTLMYMGRFVSTTNQHSHRSAAQRATRAYHASAWLCSRCSGSRSRHARRRYRRDGPVGAAGAGGVPPPPPLPLPLPLSPLNKSKGKEKRECLNLNSINASCA
ncbi:hypothetical protein IWX90DRAFT_292290 [Phyllosticta citrichinensis]|uniref:Uncharacterized protein n=1 Tax=Phyllosticta citrichinensis TaxID=1130410 RepID=A0ABR1XK20_9PEZI